MIKEGGGGGRKKMNTRARKFRFESFQDKGSKLCKHFFRTHRAFREENFEKKKKEGKTHRCLLILRGRREERILIGKLKNALRSERVELALWDPRANSFVA